MLTEEKQIILRVVENFIKTGSTSDTQVNVTRLPDNKTSFVEYVENDSRSVFLDEYRVDGKVIWAGYSARTETIYISSTK